MTKEQIYTIIKELGGQAYPDEITSITRKQLPGVGCPNHTSDGLKRLKKWKIIEYIQPNKRKAVGYYKIIAPL